MATGVFQPRQTEFYHAFPDNLILVENQEDGVLIRAARDNFSERRKALLIRELAAEGFIPDQYQFFTDTDGCSFFGVRWIIDTSWIGVPPEVIRTSHRRTWILFLCALALLIVVLDCLDHSAPPVMKPAFKPGTVTAAILCSD